MNSASGLPTQDKRLVRFGWTDVLKWTSVCLPQLLGLVSTIPNLHPGVVLCSKNRPLYSANRRLSLLREHMRYCNHESSCTFSPYYSADNTEKTKVNYGVRSPKFIWAPCHVMCTTVLIRWDPPRNPTQPPAPWTCIRGYWIAKIDDIS